MDLTKGKVLKAIRVQKKRTILVGSTPILTREGTERTIIIQDIAIGITEIRTTEVRIEIGMTRIKEREGPPLKGSLFAISAISLATMLITTLT
jgi:hypothetical protein